MKGSVVARLLLAVVLGGAIVTAIINRDKLDAAALEAWLQGFGVLAPAIFIAFYAAGTVLFLPGSVLTLLGGALFGPRSGAVYSATSQRKTSYLPLASRGISSTVTKRQAKGWRRLRARKSAMRASSSPVRGRSSTSRTSISCRLF